MVLVKNQSNCDHENLGTLWQDKTWHLVEASNFKCCICNHFLVEDQLKGKANVVNNTH